MTATERHLLRAEFGQTTPGLRRSPLAWLVHCLDRRLQRHALAELDDALLRDIGLTRQDVRRECAKPFWR